MHLEYNPYWTYNISIVLNKGKGRKVPASRSRPPCLPGNLKLKLNLPTKLNFWGIFKKILSRHGYLRSPRMVQVSDRNVQDTTASRNNQPDCPLLSTGSCIPPQIPRKPTLRPQNIDPVTIEIVGKFMFDNTKCSKFRLRRLRCKIHSLRFGGVWGGCRVDHTWKPNNSRKKQIQYKLKSTKIPNKRSKHDTQSNSNQQSKHSIKII